MSKTTLVRDYLTRRTLLKSKWTRELTTRTDTAPRIPKSIGALGFVSLLMDVSSELIHSLLASTPVGTRSQALKAELAIKRLPKEQKLHAVRARASQIPH